MKIASFVSALLLSSVLISPVFAADKKNDEKPAEQAKSVAPAKDYTILNLDGEDIKNSDVLEVWNGLFQGKGAPDFATFDEGIKQNILRGIISERLVYKEALKAGTDKNEDVKKRLDSMQRQLVMQSFMENKAKSLVTDEQIKAIYDEKAAAAKGQEEVKARHILVGSEDEAKKIVEELKKGGDFEKTAKEKSTDKGSGANGGDLGWFTKEKMVAEFADAAFKLKKGEVSAPVKSAFGWHIIKLEDRRPVKIGTLDEMKEDLRGDLNNKAIQGYIENLLKSASVKYFDENGKEKEFAKTLAPKQEEKKEEKKEDKK